jgi:diguanylate cyclase (GGDEF)-like protein/PAS domain S-box-containing protein
MEEPDAIFSAGNRSADVISVDGGGARPAALRGSAPHRGAEVSVGLDGVFEHSPAPAVVCDQDGSVLLANRAAVLLFGHLVRELTGLNLPDLFHAEDRPDVRGAVGELVAGRLALYRGTHRVAEGGGSETWVELSVVAHRPADPGRPGLIAHCHDVTARCQNERELRHLADHDALTGLLNARGFGEALRRHAAHAARYGPGGALLVLDIDHFKTINDAHGHQVGDQVLIAVAGALTGALRESDLAARVGGDEFAILLPHADSEDVRAVGSRIVDAVRRLPRNPLHDQPGVTVSIGSAPITTDSSAIENAMRAADQAMYQTKRNAGDGYTITRQGLP